MNASEATLGPLIKQGCKDLHLPSIGSRAEPLAEEATRSGLSHLAYLAALLETELDDRAERRRHRLISEAKFPRLKRLEDFKFEDAPQIPVATVRELATCRFVERAENVILLGESGTGKSHLAIGLGIASCMQSRRTRFTTTAGLVNELLEARSDRSLSRVIARYRRYDLLVLDDFCYLPLAQHEAELLFQVLDERSELTALVVTTNLPFSEWTKMFPDARLCRAVVDRLTFNAHIVETGADSWRFKKTLNRQGKAVMPDSK